ncbi:MAG TPA: phage terminase small subunit [Croceicoccus sp.]|nr:phage terminase small subunit [Croceicoccus sp.]
MFSPALRNRQRILARQPVGKAAHVAPPMPTTGPVASEYQLLLASLGLDLNTLRNIESIERKIEAKRTMIDRYLPWVDGAIEGDTGAQDEVVVTVLIWLIDLALWPTALDVARYVLAHDLQLPERYSRKPATLIAEEFAEAGLRSPPEIDLVTLQAVQELTAGVDMHDQVRAKLHKAIGLALAARADAFDPEAESGVAGGKAALLDAALAELNRALGLNSKSGVKKLIEKLERDRKAIATPATD